MEMEGLKTSDYYFDLPKELIAQDPLEDRSASRLLVMDRQTGATSHHIFKEICSFLKPGDQVTVVCLGKDKMGRMSFSMKDVAQV